MKYTYRVDSAHRHNGENDADSKSFASKLSVVPASQRDLFVDTLLDIQVSLRRNPDGNAVLDRCVADIIDTYKSGHVSAAERKDLIDHLESVTHKSDTLIIDEAEKRDVDLRDDDAAYQLRQSQFQTRKHVAGMTARVGKSGKPGTNVRQTF